jgi:SMODS and SLOG-associating 2TM effector domain
MADAHKKLGGRPATNLGIYQRVVEREEKAKKSYTCFSWLINGCLGLQIIVAASLTAMGAAGASHSAVTVFGAVNTVIAGVLTFLKGSGLPNRLKYYQTEWAEVRELIEQQERDFGRRSCELDPKVAVEKVMKMYKEVNMAVEASTPERFSGNTSAKKSMEQNIEAPRNRPTKFRTTSEDLSVRSKESESRYGGSMKELASETRYKPNQTRGTERDMHERQEHDSEDDSGAAKEFANRAERPVSSFGDIAKDDAGGMERAASSRFDGPITTDLTATPHTDSRLGKIPPPATG